MKTSPLPFPLFLAGIAATAVACGGSPTTTNGPGTNTASTQNTSTGDGDGDADTSAGAELIDESGPDAPDFTLDTLDGDSLSLSDYQGDKVVLIDFWSTTCKPCLAEMPELIELYESRKDRGFEILAVSTDGPETLSNVQSVVKKIGMPFPILLDEETEVMDRYNPKGELPFTVIVNKAGKIVFKRASFQAGDTKAMQDLAKVIDESLAR